MSTFQFWLDRFEQTIDAYLKKTVPGVCRDLSVRQFHSASFLDLYELREKLGGKVNIDAQTRADTQHLGDCCMMTFFEFGLSMQKDGFYDQEQTGKLEYRYSVNDLFYLTNDVLLLKENDRDSSSYAKLNDRLSCHGAHGMGKKERRKMTGILIVHWWLQLNLQIWPIKRRSLFRQWNPNKTEQTRGRQNRRHEKQLARLEPLLEVYFSSEKITLCGLC